MIRRRVSRTVVTAIAIAAGTVGSCKDISGPLIITAPSGVTVTLLTPTSARITWVAPPEAIVVVSYNVMRDGAKIGETSSTSFVDNGLVEGVTYRYQVSANGISGELSALSADTPAATITAPDVTAPTVLSVSPPVNANAVARVAGITVTFNENIDPTTINATTFIVKGPGGATLPGTLTYNAATRVAEFKADGLLPNAAVLAVTITTGVTDSVGNRLASDFTFSFSTRDEVPPAVTSTSPATASTGVPVAAPVVVTFDEDLDPSTVIAASFVLTKTANGSAVAFGLSLGPGSKTVTLTPSAPLESVTEYTVSVAGVKDVAGNAMASAYSFSFTTADASAPSIVSVSPLNAATSVSVESIVNVVFSEPMDAATINATTISLRATVTGTPVTGVVAYIPGNTATLTPTSPLSYSTSYTVVVMTGVKDLAGNALTSGFSSEFSTAAQPDGTPPAVVSTVPANGAANVPVGTVIAAAFTEAMDPTSINAATLTLTVTSTGASVPGTVSYDESAKTAVFTPAASLSFGATYTATITTGAKDLAGNALTTSFSSQFSTAAQPDVTPPAVVSTVPANGAVNVPVGAAIAAAFTEAMNQASINAGTFTLKVASTGALVSGVVSYDASGNVAVLTPAAPLSFGTAYTATITTSAKDLAGNPVASETSWSFGTASAPDLIAPTVVATAPADGDGGISVNAVVTVTFSETMDANTINSATVRLTNNTTSTAVTGVVSYNPANNSATLTPNAPLAFASAYSITVTTGARDAAGNPVATAFSAIFGTMAAPDTSPPTVLAVTPANGAANVAVGTNVTVTFSEPMNDATINSTTVNLRGTSSGTLVGGSVAYDPGTNTATFTPSSPLAFSTGYTVTVTTGAKDLTGNSLPGTVTSGFTTGVAPDTTPPTVSGTIPTSGATNVAVTTTVTVTFSETMSAGTINGTTIRLRNTATNAEVGGAVSFNSGTNTATFTPNASLANATGYTIVVSTGVKDQAGNSLASTFTSSFNTVAAADNIAPTVISTSPANGSQDVPPDGIISVTFSEPMNAATINTSTFLMVHASNGTAVPGSVAYNPATRVATFTPSTTLFFEDYTATVTTGVRDVAGNPLAQNFSFTFKFFASVPNLTGYWSGTTLDGSLHVHVTVDHSTGGATFSLRPNGCAGRQDECRVYPLTAEGQSYLNSDFPADVTSASGTFSDPQTSMTFTANGIVFTFTATVSTFYLKLTGTISGGTLPTQSLVMDRVGP